MTEGAVWGTQKKLCFIFVMRVQGNVLFSERDALQKVGASSVLYATQPLALLEVFVKQPCSL